MGNTKGSQLQTGGPWSPLPPLGAATIHMSCNHSVQKWGHSNDLGPPQWSDILCNSSVKILYLVVCFFTQGLTLMCTSLLEFVSFLWHFSPNAIFVCILRPSIPLGLLSLDLLSLTFVPISGHSSTPV